MENYEACPVALKTTDEIKVRITASLVLLMLAVFLFTGFWPLLLILMVDFFLRAMGLGAYSVFNKLSGKLFPWLNKQPRPVDLAPKQFAAKIGLLFVLFILAAFVGGYVHTSYVLTGIIIFFAFLESVFGFCTGCYIYKYYRKIFRG